MRSRRNFRSQATRGEAGGSGSGQFRNNDGGAHAPANAQLLTRLIPGQGALSLISLDTHAPGFHHSLMSAGHSLIQHLLTLPPQMAAAFATLEDKREPAWFASSDPAGSPLGSGGGTAQLMFEAWQKTGGGLRFDAWLCSSRKLVLHAGGQSRRLPAYAATGKLLMPMPVFRWARGQRLDQSLLDLQLPDYERVLRQAGNRTPVMICSGDVLLRFGRQLPPFPDVDVLGLGMWVAPEKAKDFGVFFSSRQDPAHLAFFLQKPAPDRIRELAETHLPLVDTGMWLLSARAVQVLMRKCGWQDDAEQFAGGRCGRYELYSDFGLSLGSSPAKPDPDVQGLTSAVIPLPEAEFYHFGTSEQLVESVARLQTRELDESKTGLIGAGQRPDQVTQNSRFAAQLRRGENHSLWVENSVIPRTWHLESGHVLTGMPQNTWSLRLRDGDCLDAAPVGDNSFCFRAYGFRDSFSGVLREATWLNRPALQWFTARGIAPADCGIDAEVDIQECPLFPVLKLEDMHSDFMQWLMDAEPVKRPDLADVWRMSRRLSARQIGSEISLRRLYAQRAALRNECLVPMMRNFRSSVFFRLDLESTARCLAASGQSLPELPFASTASASSLDDPMHPVHDSMVRSAVLRHSGDPQWRDLEHQAFGRLREMIAREAQLSPANPEPNILEDQIVWARSPVRFDLAGGWTDTPPYCIEHGGQVLNLAVDLNSQPPIQVFARLTPTPELVMRSIDLGLEERVRTFQELDTFAQPDSPFALAKAAFALAGFLPRFHADGGLSTLKEQLETFGGGIELSLLSAVPKGSGLGTSSILAATVLAALSDACGLNWDKNVLFKRTLALEQMLTTGGGWQDQAGAIFRGIKLIETLPGLAQKPTLRWLPAHLFERDYANRSILLYYTGITRLAKNILAEIVRGLFLNSPAHLACIADIGANAALAANAIQTCDNELLIEAIRNSWRLNQQLDAGTNPPAVQAILDDVEDYTAAAKLLGAGGGGYLLLFAKDDTAGARIRQQLTANPPNRRARFVDFALSETGLQLTRS